MNIPLHSIRISKSSYLLGLRCMKALYLKTYMPELSSLGKNGSESFALQAGHEFEKTARQFIAPNGQDISEGMSFGDLTPILVKTSYLLSKRNASIFQAAFRTPTNELALSDVVRKQGRKIELFEIKAVFELYDYHYYDVAWQYYVMKQCGYNVSNVYIVCLNRNYVRGAELTKDLISIKDVTAKVKQLQRKIPVRISQFHEMLNSSACPDVDVGYHCSEPYDCPFKSYCWFQALPDNNIFEIKGMRLKEKMNLYYRKIVTFQSVIKEKIRLSEVQKIQVSCAVNNESIIDRERIGKWFRQFENSKRIFFLDFETIGHPVPQYQNSKPYEAVPFQYSIHLRDYERNDIRHFEYISCPKEKEDERKTFTRRLIEILGPHSTSPIIAFNKRFESGRLQYLATAFPEYEKELRKIQGRLYDLADIFREKAYYTPEMKGSYSLKYVLPAVIPDMNYDHLEVRNGDQASLHYLRMKTMNHAEYKKTRENLLRYCELDTFAMVKIFETLKALPAEAN